MLPLVRRIVEDILKVGREIRHLAVDDQKDAGDPQLDALMDQLDEFFDELEALGCSYKDWDFSTGLVDFPSQIRGRNVQLCWRSDEPDVRFYHELDSGYENRKPIPEETTNG